MAQDKTKEIVRVIDAPISDVWAIIAAFGSEKLWFPNVIQSSLEGFGIGHTITYLILGGVPNTKHPRGTLKLTAISDIKTQFSWSGASEWTEPTFKPVLAGMLDEMFNGCMDAIESIFK
ncbi:hypothetical protein BDP81DRAFT_462674 [Colletotrichum phormii]|uniref:Uncharacterized protein n=1 Tax=Colletotrichum phormii TaxID=359342 RepID=A0AAI9ZNJ1_9PEZI|nr:uncharacterized protein BDP81DRAFT_462674 [Colletotrichum phormii]KAK1634950.1 hypothetical protein BDP81DRAFT_462674 [Colletotrichum phormii]